MDVKEKIKQIEKQIEETVKDIESSQTLLEIKMKFLGKTGENFFAYEEYARRSARRTTEYG